MRVSNAARLALAAFGGYAAYAWLAQRRFEELDPETAGAPGAFIEVEGVRLHYVEAGKGDPVVLIHGWNGSTFSFRYTIPELARTHRVIAIDLLGFGYSARPARGDYSVTAQLRLVTGLMDRLGIERAAVVGHSMGGGIAMHLALSHPERVERLVLVDEASEREARRGLRAGKLLRHGLFLLSPLALHAEPLGRAVFRLAVHDPAMLTPEVFEGYARPLRVRGHLRGVGRQLRDRGREPVLEPARIRQPTLVLWGEHDRIISLPAGQELAQRIDGARLEMIRSAGHLPLEEQPETCNRVILEFLGAAEAAPSTAGSAIEVEHLA
jgi:pimeloyl-ACP methyl ester carboxylesterase